MPENPSHAGMSAVDTVIGVLREVLGVANISPDDDFFQLGGHSMQILNIISMLRADHGLDLPVRQFGMDTHVHALAAACRPVPSPTGDHAR